MYENFTINFLLTQIEYDIPVHVYEIEMSGTHILMKPVITIMMFATCTEQFIQEDETLFTAGHWPNNAWFHTLLMSAHIC